jgi:hypothetical protein
VVARGALILACAAHIKHSFEQPARRRFDSRGHDLLGRAATELVVRRRHHDAGHQPRSAGTAIRQDRASHAPAWEWVRRLAQS